MATGASTEAASAVPACTVAANAAAASASSVEGAPAGAASVEAISVGAASVSEAERVDDRFEALCRRSRSLVYKMPTTSNRLQHHCGGLLPRRAEAVAHADGTRPLCHAQANSLIERFLENKQRNGNAIERAVYCGMSAAAFYRRLLTKRPLMFMTGFDRYLLRDGKTVGNGAMAPPRFDDIGTERELAPLVLADYQSYEEMELSALLGVSVPTHFINKGHRANRGVLGAEGSFEPKGIYVALVGSRFEREGLMEWKHMVVTPSQNTTEKGYGASDIACGGCVDKAMLREWAKLYGLDHFPTYEAVCAEHAATVAAAGRFVKLGATAKFLDTAVYRARCELVAEMFLTEANDRAESAKAKAFCHAVGLGLGVWQVSPIQVQLQVDAYAAAAARLDLPHVGELHFSWFEGASSCGSVASSGNLCAKDGTAIRVVFDRRDPAEPLPGRAPDGLPWLLVAQYAWDGNSYAGNEYWGRALDASGDPAAACCSFIPELQNPDVNTEAFSGDAVRVICAPSPPPRSV